MKTFLWVCLGFAVTGLAFWIVTTTETLPPRPLPLLMLALVFAVSPIGSFWMMYMAIRYEKRPLAYVFLAFIPYFFLGYYFERVRGRRNLNSDLRKRTIL
jgi:drug/metabolite transporter (DMT)-like permease